MKKQFTLTLLAIFATIASFALTPITGPSATCIGSSETLHDTTAGGTWSSSNTAVATVTLSTGVVTGVSAGTTTITYTVGTSIATMVFTVSGTMPAPITGTTSFCVGTTSTLADATPGGVWSTSSTYYAPVGSATGVVTGAVAGSAMIYYHVGACSVSTMVTITTTVVGTIVGPTTVCPGATITLSDSSSVMTSGTWTSSNPSVATISSGGVVLGVATGTTTISYSVTGACGTGVATRTIHVSATTSTGTITGTSSIMTGAAASWYETVSGGTWSSSNPSVATISSSGVVTGVSVGTATISYAISGCSGLVYATAPITVTAFNGISGNVLFTGAACHDAVKVWLITYNSSTLILQAIDSTIVYATGSSAFYQFTGMPTDNYRVKAALDSSTATTGYTPTYHTSNAYWSAATVIAHTSGTGDINKDITMGYGTVTTGPGFIGGNVTMGANKGTSGTVPAVGLLMYVQNSSTGAIMQKTLTDASGNYSFSNLPIGTYFVHPELMNYATTPYTGITLTAATPSVTAASFVEHTVSKTITPVGTGIISNQANAASVVAYPNPTSGKLNIGWNIGENETANATVTDVTGRVVFHTAMDMSAGSGASQLDLGSLNNGVYMISIRSASINYNNKVEITH